jgi:ammonia channel protein AmtB
MLMFASGVFARKSIVAVFTVSAVTTALMLLLWWSSRRP